EEIVAGIGKVDLGGEVVRALGGVRRIGDVAPRVLVVGEVDRQGRAGFVGLGLAVGYGGVRPSRGLQPERAPRRGPRRRRGQRSTTPIGRRSASPARTFRSTSSTSPSRRLPSNDSTSRRRIMTSIQSVIAIGGRGWVALSVYSRSFCSNHSRAASKERRASA